VRPGTVASSVAAAAGAGAEPEGVEGAARSVQADRLSGAAAAKRKKACSVEPVGAARMLRKGMPDPRTEVLLGAMHTERLVLADYHS